MNRIKIPLKLKEKNMLPNLKFNHPFLSQMKKIVILMKMKIIQQLIIMNDNIEIKNPLKTLY